MRHANFNFHPIGQGCFYTGEIYLADSNNTFNFVYDCGTDSKAIYLNNEIDKYKNRIIDKSLDLLIISHFHDDHVSGVFRLLDGIHCKRLIIPYYLPIERLLLYAKSFSKNDDYRLMLQNPINFFSNDRFNIDEIILIGGPDKENKQDAETRQNPPFDKKTLENILDIKEFEFEAEFLNESESKQMINNINELESDHINANKLKLLSRPYAVLSSIWVFLFYLQRRDIDITNFANDIDDLLEINKITLKDIFEVNILIELREIYRRHFNVDLNTTSLVLFHEPLFKIENPSHFYLCNNLYISSMICSRNKFGTLLTGDIYLNTITKIQKLQDYFNGNMGQVCVFQVPHHGSARNWLLTTPNSLESFCYYLINHALGRKSHPSLKVVEHIKTNSKGIIILNNEIDFFRYGF